jgi:hypothetical protein
MMLRIEVRMLPRWLFNSSVAFVKSSNFLMQSKASQLAAFEFESFATLPCLRAVLSSRSPRLPVKHSNKSDSSKEADLPGKDKTSTDASNHSLMTCLLTPLGHNTSRTLDFLDSSSGKVRSGVFRIKDLVRGCWNSPGSLPFSILFLLALVVPLLNLLTSVAGDNARRRGAVWVRAAIVVIAGVVGQVLVFRGARSGKWPGYIIVTVIPRFITAHVLVQPRFGIRELLEPLEAAPAESVYLALAVFPRSEDTRHAPFGHGIVVLAGSISGGRFDLLAARLVASCCRRAGGLAVAKATGSGMAVFRAVSWAGAGMAFDVLAWA